MPYRLISPATRALLFDMDGTLADTEPLHLQAVRQLLAREGRRIAQSVFERDMSGLPSIEVMARLFPGIGRDEQLALTREKERLFRDLAADLLPTAGLLDLLDHARHHGLKVAVVTNAPRDNADRLLAVLGLAGRFDAVVIGGELERSKPDPLPYATALARLDIAPDAALAFEDSLPGIASATAAGIATIGLTTALAEGPILAAGARLAIPDFAALRNRQAA